MGTLRLFTSIAAAYTEPPAVDPRETPSTYLLPTRDRTLRTAWMAEVCHHRLGIEPVLLDVGHCPHVSSPGRVTDLLLAAALDG